MFFGTAYKIDTINKKFTLRMDSETLTRSFKIKKLNGKLFPQIDGIIYFKNNGVINWRMLLR